VDLLETESEAPHAVEDLVRGLDPFERRAAVVMRVHVGEDGSAQLRNARVRSAFERLLGEEAEEAFHQVEPRRVGRREMKVDPGMAHQPPLHRRRAVGRKIVEDDVDLERGCDGRFDLAQKGEPAHLDHGYAVTSHSALGATAERAIVHAESNQSAALVNERFAYVTGSRMRDSLDIYTDNSQRSPRLSSGGSTRAAAPNERSVGLSQVTHQLNDRSQVVNSNGTSQLGQVNHAAQRNSERHAEVVRSTTLAVWSQRRPTSSRHRQRPRASL
jgi:hypothetical protein